MMTDTRSGHRGRATQIATAMSSLGLTPITRTKIANSTNGGRTRPSGRYRRKAASAEGCSSEVLGLAGVHARLVNIVLTQGGDLGFRQQRKGASQSLIKDVPERQFVRVIRSSVRTSCEPEAV